MDEQTADLAAKALLEVEWTGHGGGTFTCLGCHSGWTFQRVHVPTCRVDAALTRLGYPDRASRDDTFRKLRDDDFEKRWATVPAVVLAVSPAEEAMWDSPTPTVQRVPDSPTSDDGGD